MSAPIWARWPTRKRSRLLRPRLGVSATRLYFFFTPAAPGSHRDFMARRLPQCLNGQRRLTWPTSYISLWAWASCSRWLRTPIGPRGREGVMLDLALGAIVAAGLAGYLVYALLH